MIPVSNKIAAKAMSNASPDEMRLHPSVLIR
jgi:hypothetical protein